MSLIIAFFVSFLIFSPSATSQLAGQPLDKIVAIEQCHLQEEPTNRVRLMIRDFALQHQLPFYDIKQHTGWLRNVQV
ncbi:MAG: hypothetical protein ACK42Z_05340, partial [Candidatus Kapaibacteriota bacterium]